MQQVHRYSSEDRSDHMHRLKGGQNEIKGELTAQTMISSWKWSLTSDPLQRTYSKQLPASSFNSQSIEQEVKGIASICDHPSNSKCHST